MDNQPVLFTTNHRNVFGSQVPDEAGIYNVSVSPQSIAKNSSNNNPMASMNYVVLDGTQKGKHIFDRLTWTANTQENHDLSVKRFNTVMMAAGFQDGVAVHSIPEFVQQMTNQRFAVETEWQRSDNGNYYLNVKSYQQLLANGSQPNGIKRPQNNNQSNKFGNSNYNSNQQQAQPYGGNGAPIDIDDSQLPF